MVEDAAKRLTEHVLEKAGDGLRTVIVVSESGYEVSYLREDLQETYSREGFAEVVDAFRLEQPFLSPGLQQQPVGERRALVHYHENACIIQIPYSKSETILISLSQEAGRDLVGFIESCRQVVAGTK